MSRKRVACRWYQTNKNYTKKKQELRKVYVNRVCACARLVHMNQVLFERRMCKSEYDETTKFVERTHQLTWLILLIWRNWLRSSFTVHIYVFLLRFAYLHTLHLDILSSYQESFGAGPPFFKYVMCEQIAL